MVSRFLFYHEKLLKKFKSTDLFGRYYVKKIGRYVEFK